MRHYPSCRAILRALVLLVVPLRAAVATVGALDRPAAAVVHRLAALAGACQPSVGRGAGARAASACVAFVYFVTSFAGVAVDWQLARLQLHG